MKLRRRIGPLLFLALAACGSTFSAATPPGFVELDDRYGNDELRAVNAEGVVLGTRSFDNEPKGETTFWSRVVENQMRKAGGYALLEKRPAETRSGLKGTQLRFGRDEGKDPHLYIVTLFVNDDRIYLLEAGGTKEQVERVMPHIDWSVRNFVAK